MNETDTLIAKIKKWKSDKDEAVYQAKLVEENATNILLEEINSSVVSEAQNILKIYDTLKSCGVKYIGKNYIHICQGSSCYVEIPFGYCRGYISPQKDEIYFRKVDGNGYLTNETANPPCSAQLEQFIKDFKNLKKDFYDFVDKTLKN